MKVCHHCEREAIRLTALITASEDWSTEYKKDPETHAKLIKKQSKWQIELVKMYRELAQKSHLLVNWGSYNGQLMADYNVEVLINDDGFDEFDGEFIKISLDLVADIIAAGAKAGENIYKIPLGIESTDAIIQKLATDRVAALVGKKVLKDGTIVDNPRAEMNITETIRENILQSIKTSLALGEDAKTAMTRMQEIIDNPTRAEMITRTESVNAYQAGLREFADESDAKGKEWQTAGGCEICEGNAAAGPIPVSEAFPSGDMEPVAHPNCRCGIRYLYKNEWDKL